MSSTSKYSALPYIATGESDIFETEDLPEVDQLGLQQPLYDASIEIIPSGTIEAYEKFSSNEDNQSLKLEKESNESYVDKFNRLKTEIEELKNATQSDNCPENLFEEINSLTSKLDNLQDFQLKKYDASNIVSEIKSVEKPNDDSALLKYELFCKPEKEHLVELSKINFLEQRIKKIENILGVNDTAKDSNFFLFTNYLKDQSIMNIIVQLSNKVVQLDHSSLDRIDSRLNVISEKLKQISEKKSFLQDVDKENKLNEIYNSYVKTNQSRNSLPNILERLQVLNNVQEQASQFAATLSGMKSLQSEIQISFEKNSQNLKSLQELFQTKTEDIKQIVNDFNERIEKLKK